MKRIIIIALLTVCFQWAFATVYEVSTLGNDVTGNGSLENPWRTLKFAVTKVPAGKGHSIKLSAGTFVESGQFNVPVGVNLEGAGIDQTIVKAAGSFYYHPADPGFSTNKFLITLSSTTLSNGNQSLKNLTIDGDEKQLHGGIYVYNRNNVIIENVKVQYANFCGVWLMDTNDCNIRGLQLKDCAWGNTGWCSGALQFANSKNLNISGFNIDEGRGYGMKNLGHSSKTPVSNVKIHDGRVSVNPVGIWNGGQAPNISIELWGSSFPGTEIYNCYIDNTVSLVNDAEGISLVPIKVYNNTFDILGPRAKGKGYSIELSLNDAEIYNNWFNGGYYGIANWGNKQYRNWNIHHNSFYSINWVINAYKGGLKNVNILNNTVEMTKDNITFMEFNWSGVGENINIKNNLIFNSEGNAKLIILNNGASVKNTQISNNLFYNLFNFTVSGATYSNNLTVDPKLNKNRERPSPYYTPLAGSPLIDAGLDVGYPFQGSAPDIGAFESRPTTSLEMQKTGKPIYSFPNPAKSGDVLQVNLPEVPGEVTILDMAGVTRCMLHVTDNKLQIPTAGLFGGMYLLQYRTPKGCDVVKIMIR